MGSGLRNAALARELDQLRSDGVAVVLDDCARTAGPDLNDLEACRHCADRRGPRAPLTDDRAALRQLDAPGRVVLVRLAGARYRLPCDMDIADQRELGVVVEDGSDVDPVQAHRAVETREVRG